MTNLFLCFGALFAVATIAHNRIEKATNETENRPYELIKADGKFEIRYYPPYQMTNRRNEVLFRLKEYLPAEG